MSARQLRIIALRFLVRLLKLYWKVRKPTTLGTRALLIRGQEVLLVSHTYMDGWHLPGGGVKNGESFRDAMIRELREECALSASAEDLVLFGLYFSSASGNRDHIAVYIIRDSVAITQQKPDFEIEECRFFSLANLPDAATPATRRRLNEYLQTQKYGSVGDPLQTHLEPMQNSNW